MRTSRGVIARLLAGVGLLAAIVCGRAALATDSVTITVAGMNKQIYLPAVLAQQLGYFADENLKVELLDTPTGIEAENELLAGGAGVETVADLKGARVGVVGLGSSTEMLLRYIASRSGLTAAGYHPVPVGAGDDFVAAMTSGLIRAGMTTEPTVGRMLRTGEARILVDLRTPESSAAALGVTYPGASLYVESSWLAAHRPAAQKLARAFVRTLRYIASHDAVELAALVPPAFWAGDKDLYIASLSAQKSVFSVDGRMPKDGPATMAGIFTSLGANRGKVIDISRTYTDEFVDAAAH